MFETVWCLFSSILWLQGRRGFPQTSILQRSNYATFIWWSRTNQSRDYCSPGNRKSECLTFYFLFTLTHTDRLTSLCSNISFVVCNAGSTFDMILCLFLSCCWFEQMQTDNLNIIQTVFITSYISVWGGETKTKIILTALMQTSWQYTCIEPVM